MARGREGMAKRARERRREQRKEDKAARREALAAEPDGPAPDEEVRLMEQFRVLSERHAAGQVTERVFAEERERIFGELGIDT